MTPIVNRLTTEFAGKVNVYQLDAAQPAVLTLQQKQGVRGHPSFTLVNANGEVAERLLGPQDEQELREALTDMLTP